MNDPLSRRDLLRRAGALTLGALAFPSARDFFVARSAPTAANDLLVCVFLRGAADGLNLVVPYGDKEYYAARATLAIPQPKAGDANAAIDLDGFFGLHPALAPLKDLFSAGALAIVHAVGSPDPTHSHFDAMDYMERGTPGDKSLTTGWLGRYLQTAASSGSSAFRAVGLGTIVPQSLRGPIAATALQSIPDFRLQVDARLAQRTQTALATLYAGTSFIEENGKLTLQAMRDLAKLASSHYAPSHNAQYPETTFGKSLATIAQLIKADLGVQVACLDLGGWDTHVQAEAPMTRLAEEFGKGLGAFYADLQDQMKRITLVTMSEFGRRAQENSNRGTDHGHGGVMFVLGGNVIGGKVYGDWPTLNKDKLYGPGDLAITTDFRDVLGEIVQKRLGNSNLAAIFPNYPTFKFRGLVRESAA
ncbi:MAG: DUF1501 domain-containing protein [Chloroflexi bacterium]|nr:DUF1501 domain-containing protein [Chloroflexota bacterium]